MKQIAVVTATRAEYGLLSGVITALRARESDDLTVRLIVTGTHLSEQYGMTVREIEQDGHRIDFRVPIPLQSNSEQDISQNQAATLVAFTDLFLQQRFDAVVLLGDRYETLAIAIAAGNTHTPVFHLCGGDTTEGALDEWIRHSITKISYLHFPTNEQSRQRIIQLGEDPARVLNFGSTGVDNILSVATMSKTEALASVGLPDCRYVLCTYHPVTMETDGVDAPMREFLKAIAQFPHLQFIVTKSNADQGGARINALLDEAAEQMPHLHVFPSLGIRRYLSLMRYAELVLGNSSSGILEAPAFRIPTVNIGNRQKGRLQVASILNCGSGCPSICAAMEKAMTEDMKQQCLQVENPYGDGHAAPRIAQAMAEAVQKPIDLKKTFYLVK